MPAFDMDKFMAKIDAAQAPEDIDAAFAGLSALKPQTRTRAINTIERGIVSEMRHIFNEISVPELRAEIEIVKLTSSGPLRDILGVIDSLFGEEQPEPEENNSTQDLKLAAQTVLNISNIKGDKADPLLKAFVAEAAKMTDREYNSDHGQMTLVLRMAEKVQAEAQAAAKAAAPKPAGNPFRK